MANPGTSQPNLLPIMNFRLDDVQVFEGGAFQLNSTNIIADQNPLTIRTDLGLEGQFYATMIGETMNVEHHFQQIETGSFFTLPGGFVIIPANPLLGNHLTAEATFVTGVAPLVVGTYRVTTHVHPARADLARLFAAFGDGLIVQVV